MGSEKKGRLQQVFCNRVGVESGWTESGGAEEVKICQFILFKPPDQYTPILLDRPFRQWIGEEGLSLLLIRL